MTRLTATSRLINKFTQNGYLFSAAEAAQDSFPEITLAGLSKLVDQMTGNLAVSSMLFGTLLVGGDISTAISQITKSQIGNMADVAPLNPGGVNGSLLLYARNVVGAEIVMATQNTVRGRWSSTGLNVLLGISSATSVVGTDPTGAAILRVGGLVRSGATATAGYQFDDRSTGDTWTWSATGGSATLTTTVNSPITIVRATGAITTPAGITNTTGDLIASAGACVVRGIGSNTGHVASQAFLDYSGGGRLVSYGADNVTNGIITLISRRSDGTNSINVLLSDTSGNAVFGANLKATGAFGCNGGNPQTAFASGGALAGYVAGANGLDTGAHMASLHALVVAMRTALVNNGIMS